MLSTFSFSDLHFNTSPFKQKWTVLRYKKKIHILKNSEKLISLERRRRKKRENFYGKKKKTARRNFLNDAEKIITIIIKNIFFTRRKKKPGRTY
jgi:hypothetical protein